MKQLLNDYKRRLNTLNEELRITLNENDDITKIAILSIKRGCYRTFISELEKIVPYEKPIDPKIIAEERKAREEKEKEYKEKQADWNRRMEAGEFEYKDESPEEF